MIFTSHTFKSSGIVFLVTFLLISCQAPVKNRARDFTYFLELIDSSSDQRYKDSFFREIEDEILDKKYAITKKSEGSWPFYQVFEKDQSVSLDSLTPPHVATHLFLRDLSDNATEGDYRVTVVFRDPENEMVNFDQYNYILEGTGWKIVANTGNHSLTPQKMKGLPPSETASKIIIRYSFK